MPRFQQVSMNEHTYSLRSLGLIGSSVTNSPKQTFTLESVHSVVTPTNEWIKAKEYVCQYY